MTRSGLAATLKLCPSTICVVTQPQSSQVRIVRPPSILTRQIADNNFRYYLNTNIFMQSQYKLVKLQMSIRIWMVAERLENGKFLSIYFCEVVLHFCKWVSTLPLGGKKHINSSPVHRNNTIIPRQDVPPTWWQAGSRSYSGDRWGWSHSWRTVYIYNNMNIKSTFMC